MVYDLPDDVPVVFLLEMGIVNDDGICQADVFIFFNFLLDGQVPSFPIVRVCKTYF